MIAMEQQYYFANIFENYFLFCLPDYIVFILVSQMHSFARICYRKNAKEMNEVIILSLNHAKYDL